MNARITLIALLAATFAGCAAQPNATVVASYDRGLDPELIQVSEDGDYALYSTFDTLPIVTYPLQRGDSLGFARGERGRITAIAGRNRVNLEDKSYTWQKK